MTQGVTPLSGCHLERSAPPYRRRCQLVLVNVLFFPQVKYCGRILNPPIDPISGAAEAFISAKGRRPKDYAFKTVPSGLVVKPSSIPGAGLGVWTSKCLKKGLILGPYQGVRVDWEISAHQSRYCWEVVIPNFVFI